MEAFKEIYIEIFEFALRLLRLLLWVLTGVVILPCVFIANHFFPKWVEWGEGF